MLDHVQIAIPVGSEDVARSFYIELLGFEEVPKPPELARRGGLWLRSESINLHLGVEEDFRPARKAHPAFRCVGYAEFVKRLQTQGVDFASDEHLFEGKAHGYVADPFGNRIELIAE